MGLLKILLRLLLSVDILGDINFCEVRRNGFSDFAVLHFGPNLFSKCKSYTVFVLFEVARVKWNNLRSG